jgi:hypothetical protein
MPKTWSLHSLLFAVWDTLSCSHTLITYVTIIFLCMYMLSKIIKTTMIIYWNHFHLTSAIIFLYHVIKVLKAIIASFGNLGIFLTHENYLKFLGLYFLYGQRVWKLFVHQLFSVKDKKQGAQLWSSRPLVLRYLLITNCVALVWKGGGTSKQGQKFC